MADVLPIGATPQQKLQAQLDAAYERGRADMGSAVDAAYERGRTDIEPAIAKALPAVLAPIETQFQARLAEQRAAEKAHVRTAGDGGFWRGFGVGSVIMAIVTSLSVWAIAKDAQMTNAAARAYEERGGISPSRLTIGDGSPDVTTQDSGYARRGEPASAER